MLNLTDDLTPTAPSSPSVPDAHYRMTAPWPTPVPTPVDRLVSRQATDGFGINGHEAHAAVRTHVDRATRSTWTTVQKGKAPTSSAGRLRSS